MHTSGDVSQWCNGSDWPLQESSYDSTLFILAWTSCVHRTAVPIPLIIGAGILANPSLFEPTNPAEEIEPAVNVKPSALSIELRMMSTVCAPWTELKLKK